MTSNVDLSFIDRRDPYLRVERVVDKLEKDIGLALDGQDLRDWVAQHGVEPMNMTRAEFVRFIGRFH